MCRIADPHTEGHQPPGRFSILAGLQIISPLSSADGVEYEMKTVDSELENIADSCPLDRKYLLLVSLACRFAQFFISPLISADGVEREVKAVDSEHGKNLAVDAWRFHQLNKATANLDHPFARFFTGDKSYVCISEIASI